MTQTKAYACLSGRLKATLAATPMGVTQQHGRRVGPFRDQPVVRAIVCFMRSSKV